MTFHLFNISTFLASMATSNVQFSIKIAIKYLNIGFVEPQNICRNICCCFILHMATCGQMRLHSRDGFSATFCALSVKKLHLVDFLAF